MSSHRGSAHSLFCLNVAKLQQWMIVYTLILNNENFNMIKDFIRIVSLSLNTRYKSIVVRSGPYHFLLTCIEFAKSLSLWRYLLSIITRKQIWTVQTTTKSQDGKYLLLTICSALIPNFGCLRKKFESGWCLLSFWWTAHLRLKVMTF